MQILWSSIARRDLDRHITYLATHNPVAALRVDEAIRAAVERLVELPHRGRPGQRVGTRELVTTEFPAHVVVYRVTATEIRVLRVWHGRQNWRR